MHPHSRHNFLEFTCIEQLEEAARATGWNIDYRQMASGPFRAEFANLECDGVAVASERFDTKLMHVPCEPPPGQVGFFLPRNEKGRSQACGSVVKTFDLIAFPAGSELEFVTRGRHRCETIFLDQSRFLETARALVSPDLDLLTDCATIHRGDQRNFASLARAIENVWQNAPADPGAMSTLVAEVILWLERTLPHARAEQLANGAAAKIARSARDFIESHFTGSIHMDLLCRAVGTSLRTLQRSFASHYETSPFQYIKARRLNHVRRTLIESRGSNATVSQIALDNGFSHLGRFSIDYRAHFGESPSETLAALRRG